MKKILVANQGLAAVKGIRSIRRWCYETFDDEKAIQLIAIGTKEDLENNSEHILLSDHFVQIPSGPSSSTYGNVDFIVDLAVQLKVDAVFIGWGYQSENPELSAQLETKNIKFIGPSAYSMRLLGNKISSTILAQSIGIPTLPWSGDHLVAHVNQQDKVPLYLFEQAMVNLSQGQEHAKRLGYPVMIKSSEAGGGRGIRIVYKDQDFISSFLQVKQESPGSVFIMKVLSHARHLEIQILGDVYGNIIALQGRDCSVQRRHQKIVEEAPITIAPQFILDRMEQDAIRLCKLVGYYNAGTVEYLYDPLLQRYYFLELNPRLQVEHPITEMITGINLPAAQVQIAMGMTIDKIKRGASHGHVISARITAENPNGFIPNSGSISALNFRTYPNVWGYFSVHQGKIDGRSDSQFGHIFSFGKDRQEARRSLIVALKELVIQSSFKTPVSLLSKLLESKEFIGNTIHTKWLESFQVQKEIDSLFVVCCCVAQAHAAFSLNRASFERSLESGHIPSKSLLTTRYSCDFVYGSTRVMLTVDLLQENLYCVQGSEPITVPVNSVPDGLLIEYNGSHLVYYKQDYIVIDGITYDILLNHDPSQLVSSSPGKLLKYFVEDGDLVEAGQPYCQLEIMKLVMSLTVQATGRIRLLKPVGSIISCGEIIGKMELDNIAPLTLYHNQLDINQQLVSSQPSISSRVLALLQGYHCLESSDLLAREYIKAHPEGVQNLLENYTDTLNVLNGPLDEVVKQLKQSYPITDLMDKLRPTLQMNQIKQFIQILMQSKTCTETPEIAILLQRWSDFNVSQVYAGQGWIVYLATGEKGDERLVMMGNGDPFVLKGVFSNYPKTDLNEVITDEWVEFPWHQLFVKSILIKNDHYVSITGFDFTLQTPTQPRKKTLLEYKRHRAQLLGTTYVHDYPILFKLASNSLPDPTPLSLDHQELVHQPSKCGILVWEYPTFVVIANDITHKSGSFGPEEVALFLKASQYCRLTGKPRVYISATSGACMGLAQEVIDRVQVYFNDGQMDHLYLTEQDYNQVKESVIVEAVPHGYKLISIIGKEHGLGVENLSGSGSLASETCKAYKEIVTLTMITGRTVGIGAYMARLGHRIVQVKSAPLLLTGASALNKVLGKECYTNNLQLGGPQIMYENGTSQCVVDSDFHGIQILLEWLSFQHFKEAKDPIDRPMLHSIDPIDFLGANGFFDSNSFFETMGGWAQGIITGRARLGGIPCGVIAANPLPVRCISPADPALESSFESAVIEAPLVWTPFSAYKTAQTIKDVNHEKLPLFIFANWRGFSGGQSDMYKQMLKFGAMIVEELEDFDQPVYVYVIGDLRGGAWAVLDSCINPNVKMYATPEAKGGVLEPVGIVEIKKSQLRGLERLGLDPHQTHQVGLMLADLHDGALRMQSKNVIQAIIPWTESRQYFYTELQKGRPTHISL